MVAGRLRVASAADLVVVIVFLAATVAVAATATRRCSANGSSKLCAGPSGSGVRIALPRSLRWGPFRMDGT